MLTFYILKRNNVEKVYKLRKSNTAALSMRNPFAALRHKSFRYYWIGMAISTIGLWMQNTAQPWLAYELTNSPLLLSLVSALQFTPVLLFSLFAGVLIDKFNKKHILIFTQIAAMLITLVVAILDFTGNIAYWHLLVSSSLLGLVNTFDIPTRQTFVIELVGKEDLSAGIALNSAQFNLARILGPAIAGLIMFKWGTASCFFINSFSFGAVLISLIFVKPLLFKKEPMKQANIFHSISAGLRFVFSKPVLFMPLIFMAIAATFAMNFNVLVPVFAIEELKLEADGFGFLMSAAGVGALCGALTMASISRGGIKKAFIFIFPILVGGLIVLMGMSRTLLLTAVIIAVASFFYMIFMASVNTTVQLNTSNEFRGRVMSVYSLIVAGSTPIGNLFAGAISDRYSASLGFIICGAVIVLVLLPVYILRVRKMPGIAPDNSMV